MAALVQQVQLPLGWPAGAPAAEARGVRQRPRGHGVWAPAPALQPGWWPSSNEGWVIFEISVSWDKQPTLYARCTRPEAQPT